MSTTPARPNDPEVLGRYRVLGRLGRGGMGTVYLGQDETGRRVAIKVINPELSDDEAFHERFRREVTAARQVRRFSTAAVLDARLDGEPLYVVTEYVDGPTLEQAVRENGPLTGGALEGLAVNIATALGAIHGAGVVHRDLKPSNVLLSSTGPRVIDFGIARALDAVDGPTRTGQFVGTPSYIAPELMRGGTLSPAADVFSWGCVVTYAGTGRAPFSGATVHETINRVVNDPPIVDGLDPALRAIVERALAKDPAQRPDTAELLRELTGQGHPVPPPQPTGSLFEPSPPQLPAPPAPPLETRPQGTPHEPPARRPAWVRPAAIVAAAGLALAGVGYGISQMTDDGGGKLPAAKTEGPPAVTAQVTSQNFDTAPSGWPSGSEDCGGAESGHYLLSIRPAAGGGETCAVSDSQTTQIPARSLVDVRVKLGPGPSGVGWEAGLLLLKSGNDDGYAVVLRQDGTARLVKTVGTGVKVLKVAQVPGFKTADYNRLQAELDRRSGNPRIALWVNGKKTFEVTDTSQPLRQGTAGLVLYDAGTSEGVAATFDDFSIGKV